MMPKAHSTKGDVKKERFASALVREMFLTFPFIGSGLFRIWLTEELGGSRIYAWPCENIFLHCLYSWLFPASHRINSLLHRNACHFPFLNKTPTSAI